MRITLTVTTDHGTLASVQRDVTNLNRIADVVHEMGQDAQTDVINAALRAIARPVTD